MSTPIKNEFPSEHSTDEVWQAINTPIPERLRPAINRWFVISYDGLSDEGQLQTGTGITQVPSDVLRERVPAAFRPKLPHDINLRVAEHSPEDRTRLDVFESSKATGMMQWRVETGSNGHGLLMVEGELAVHGLGSFIEGPLIEHGFYEPAGLLLANLPEILSLS